MAAGSQLLMHRSLGERLNLIAPFLAYDKDPYVVVDDNGRLVYVQDAYTISDRYPNAQAFDGSTLGDTSGLHGRSFNYIRNSVKVVMDAYDGTMTFYVADPTDPLIRAWQGVFPTLFHPLDEMPAGLRSHLRVPEEIFNVQTRVFAQYHVTDPLTFLPGRRPLGRSPEPHQHGHRAAAAGGLLRLHADARRDEPGVPAAAADGPRQAAEHDRLGRRPERRPELRRRAGLPFPARHVDLRADPDRGPHRPGSDHQLPGLAVEPGREPGRPRQPHRDPGPGFDHVPRADLPPVDGSAIRSSPRSWSPARRRWSGRHLEGP